jgi:sigma-B regulation protein RsbU (phosphoserine phosphatase)
MSDLTEEPIFELRIPAFADRMSLLRVTLRSAAHHCGFDASATQDLVLAVCEACQNVIQHGYAGQEPGDIVLSMARSDDGVTVRVRDFAATVDPEKIRPRDLDDVRPGGLGIHFIENLMDSAVFLPGADGIGNVLQMTKRVDVTS